MIIAETIDNLKSVKNIVFRSSGNAIIASVYNRTNLIISRLVLADGIDGFMVNDSYDRVSKYIARTNF